MLFHIDVLLHKSTRLHLLTVCCILVGITSIVILSSALWTTQSFGYTTVVDAPRVVSGTGLNTLASGAELDLFDSSLYLRGSPTDKFRDNLLSDTLYITSWISAGWTNDVMTYMNLIYLGILTNRVPIVPMFTPSHIGGGVPPINFGEVFDMRRLRIGMNKPVIEWHEVKNRSSEVIDEVGCWNTWEAVQQHEHFPRRSSVPNRLKLDISYTRAPSWIKLIPHFEHDRFADFSSLAVLAFPEGRKEYATEPRESPESHTRLPPDEHMLCYDYLYYVCTHQSYEFDFDYSPAWFFVGQFMHWTPKLESLADVYIRKAFGTERTAETPPWIAIHVRHGDFLDWCGQTPMDSCFASVSVIARRVEEVQQEILERKRIYVQHVIMTSDEKNATWWNSVAERGWFRIDSNDTVQHYGAWYPLLIDAVIQSGGLGFVGTDRSTMSVLARRRVQSWRDGAVRTIRWGRPDSDAH
ncbi:hypothetical protein BDN70DRAFT_902572 [Pholiota conissans]|uniref:O-fucosyltransferase family protein n=1 Tax=Pholiota conissans TaxID=109636 RepID=A0A9P5ZGY1_9AGAR|nr:hypothetical protein BDN70DRAFT_902572 [Pholiota conissans]